MSGSRKLNTKLVRTAHFNDHYNIPSTVKHNNLHNSSFYKYLRIIFKNLQKKKNSYNIYKFN